MRTVHDLIAEGQQAYARNDLGRAGPLFKQALAINPVDNTASVYYAMVCARTGRAPIAIEYLRNAVKRDPKLFEAHVALTTLLFAAGKPEEAIDHGRRAIEIHPDDADLYCHVGRELAKHGAYHESVPYFESAIDLTPGGPTGWIELGRVKLAQFEFDAAVECAKRAVERDDQSADSHMLLALAYSGLGDLANSELHLRRAIVLNPCQPYAHGLLGWQLQEKGLFEEAEPLLMESLRVSPANGIAYYALHRTKTATSDDLQGLEKLAKMAENPSIGPTDRAYMYYALGKAREDLGDFRAAISDYDSANQMAGVAWFDKLQWDRETYVREFDRTIELFSPESFDTRRTWANNEATPLLVVGMIRSGTTLVEQILSSHPEIAAGGELTFWHDRAKNAIDFDTGRIDADSMQRLGQEYLETLRSISPIASHVTDKLPHNYAMLGLVHTAFPNSRIIHVKRNPLDNCLSIYTTPYGRPPIYALYRENIVTAYQQYQRIVAHWRTVLPPDRFLEIEYEHLVSDREAVIRRVIDFIGLSWSDSCLQHEQNRRIVNTPSAWQVRQAIYKTSVERWKKFEPWLGEFSQLIQSG